jgi:SdrD B-like domain
MINRQHFKLLKPFLNRVLLVLLSFSILMLGGFFNYNSKGFFSVVTSASTPTTLNFNVVLTQTGIAPFDATAGAGLDISQNDNVVRSNDYVFYRWEVAPNGGRADNVTITHTLTNGLWRDNISNITFPFCSNSDQIQDGGYTLKCNIGSVIAAQSYVVKAFANANVNQNNSLITSNATVIADNVLQTNTINPIISPIVSSIPKYDILATGQGGAGFGFNYGKPMQDENGVDGFMFDPSYSVKVQGTDFRTDIKGLEKPNAPFKLKLKLKNRDTNLDISTYKLVNWNANNPCYKGLSGAWNTPTDPTCVQSGIGNPVTISFGDTGRFGVTEQDQSRSASDKNDFQRDFIIDDGRVQIWIPASEVLNTPNHSINLRTEVFGIDFTSPSGQTNFGTGAEVDIGNNTFDFNLAENKRVDVVGKSLSAISPNYETYIQSLIPGSQIQVGSASFNRNPLQVLNNGVLCNSWDKNLLQLKAVNYDDANHGISGNNNNVLYNTQSTNVIEYSPDQNPDLLNSTCGDNDGVWYTDVGQIPNGLSSIAKIRIKNINGLGFNQQAGFTTYLEVLQNPDNTPIRTYQSYMSPDFEAGQWQTNVVTAMSWAGSYDPRGERYYDNIRTINHAPAVLLSKGMIPDAPNNDNVSAIAGKSAKYQLAVIAFGKPSYEGNPSTDDVFVQDMIPAGQEYIPDSATIIGDTIPTLRSPELVSISDPDGSGNKAILWKISNYPINDVATQFAQNYLTYKTSISPIIPNNTTQRTTSLGYAGSDNYKGCRAYNLNCPSHDITIYNTLSFYTQLTTNGSLLEPDVDFGYTVTYGNLDTNPVSKYSFILPLPSSGDSSGSDYSGTLDIANVLAQNGESITYSINATSEDPCHPSNIQAGKTVDYCTGVTGIGTATWTNNLVNAKYMMISASNIPANTVNRKITINFTALDNSANNKYITKGNFRYTGFTLLSTTNTVTNTVNTGSISGIVTKDTHNYGVKDADEKGMEGIVVTLTGQDAFGNTYNQTTTTNAMGVYSFEKLLLRGNGYNIQISTPTDYTLSYDKDDNGSTSDGIIRNQSLVFNPVTGVSVISDADFGVRLIEKVSPPVILTPLDNSTLAIINPTITGTAVANNTVTIFEGNNILGTTVADQNGNWSLVAPNMKQGNYVITATQTTPSQLVSLPSNLVNLTISINQKVGMAIKQYTKTSPTKAGVWKSTYATGGYTDFSCDSIKTLQDPNHLVIDAQNFYGIKEVCQKLINQSPLDSKIYHYGFTYKQVNDKTGVVRYFSFVYSTYMDTNGKYVPWFNQIKKDNPASTGWSIYDVNGVKIS